MIVLLRSVRAQLIVPFNKMDWIKRPVFVFWDDMWNQSTVELKPPVVVEPIEEDTEEIVNNFPQNSCK